MFLGAKNGKFYQTNQSQHCTRRARTGSKNIQTGTKYTVSPDLGKQIHAYALIHLSGMFSAVQLGSVSFSPVSWMSAACCCSLGAYYGNWLRDPIQLKLKP